MSISDKIIKHYKRGTLKKVTFNYINKPRSYLKRRYPLLLKRDLYNTLKYGIGAPRNHDRIWVNPKHIKKILVPTEVKRITGKTRAQTSGLVLDWDQGDIKTRPLMDEFKIQYCIKHWVDGVSWEDLEIVDFLKKNSKKYRNKTEDQLKARFEKLDQTFTEIESEGRLKTRKEIEPNNYRERDGILIHIGSNGELYFGLCGNHRLAIALILGLEKIPAWIGLVNPNSIEHFKKLKKG